MLFIDNKFNKLAKHSVEISDMMTYMYNELMWTSSHLAPERSVFTSLTYMSEVQTRRLRSLPKGAN